MMRAGWAFAARRNFATRFICFFPFAVSGRSSSGPAQSGQSAWPCRRKKTFIGRISVADPISQVHIRSPPCRFGAIPPSSPLPWRSSMSYRIKAGVKIGRSLCKVTRRQVACAIEASHAPRAREESPVLATRKHLKKARAALVLLAPVVSRKEIAKTDRELRKVGNLLSEMRDAEVRFQT